MTKICIEKNIMVPMGEGVLSTQAPGDEPPDVYRYDPLQPVPTVGGQVIMPGENAIGPRNQSGVELRDDVLVYWATGNVFLPGHAIRLEVSSSNFPHFDRNSNTGSIIARESPDQYRPATNRIFHDAAHPSHLILPIIL